MRLLLCLALLVAAVGCGSELQHPTTSTAVSGSGILETVEHDGHKFVVWSSFNRGGLVHHPDCPCMKRKAEAERDIDVRGWGGITERDLLQAGKADEK